jgi:hypothetical protein
MQKNEIDTNDGNQGNCCDDYDVAVSLRHMITSSLLGDRYTHRCLQICQRSVSLCQGFSELALHIKKTSLLN